MNRLKKILLTLIALFITAGTIIYGQNRYPGEKWDKASRPEDSGFDSGRLQEAKDYSMTINTEAVVIVIEGMIVDEWGKVDTKFMTHSTRKSFLSALYGKYVMNGTIDLDKTFAELGIDDEPPLSEIEKQATLRDCIKARSGIYHPALYESERMKTLKPPRHTEKPGTHWYYNNWDFNALGTVYEKLTGNKIFKALQEEIANPIQMEDFTADDGWYVTGEESIHPAYPFVITAHDMARFGLLMLRKGNWKGNQIIPAEWVEESTRYHSDAALYGSDGYGYMWWVARKYNKYPHIPGVDLPEGTFDARGAGGHYIVIIPEYDMVVVHRVDTSNPNNSVSSSEFGRLMNLILLARE
ncbi:MAG TPA: serine hydrolase [Bacteroidales bacterium]|nr:serine hydrolase [Bacteroidales bacterium]